MSLTQASAQSPASVLAPAVHKIFERSCAECHDTAQRPRPKGGFGYVLDLERLKTSDYVVAGEPDQSDLYLFLIDSDPDILMPPPDSDAPALTPDEIKTVREWIVALAAKEPEVVVEVAVLPPAGTPDPEPATPVVEIKIEGKPSSLSVSRVFARTHPMVVHFPIALLVVAALADWLGFFTRRQCEWLPVVRWMLVISSLSALWAVGAGWLLADQEGYKDATVFLHRWLGVATAVVSWLGWGLLEWAERKQSTRLRMAVRLIILLGAVLVSVTGHTGGELIYGEGYPFN